MTRSKASPGAREERSPALRSKQASPTEPQSGEAGLALVGKGRPFVPPLAQGVVSALSGSCRMASQLKAQIYSHKFFFLQDG